MGGADAVDNTNNAVDFGFKSKLPDCCSAKTKNEKGELLDAPVYKSLCDIPGKARLIEMTMPAGCQDEPHDHPQHAMYFLDDAKVEIQDFEEDGVTKKGEPKIIEIPAGAAPVFPSGPHQVKNIGTKDAKIIFVEPYPASKPCGLPDGCDELNHKHANSPFVTNGEGSKCNCYTVLSDGGDDCDWITGLMTQKPGDEDAPHFHRDHLIYVVSGGDIEIHVLGPDGNYLKDPENAEKDWIIANKGIPAGAGIAAPMAAPPFAHHFIKNIGESEIKLAFFEQKK